MCRIPHFDDPERYDERTFDHEGFVEILSSERIDVAMQYPLLFMKNAESKCLMREVVAEKLSAAAELLPEGYRFRIWDAWRPFALQHELYEVYSKNIIRDFSLEGVSEEERNAMIRKFVSDPIPDREVPPVHTTGGAIDLTIVDSDGNELDMGTAFDAFTEKTKTDYFERIDANKIYNDSYFNDKNEKCNFACKKSVQESKQIPFGNQEQYITSVRDNRRLLFGVMTKAGFTNLPSEWWHYDYGDRFWAYYNKRSAIYEGVFTKEEIDGWREYHG